MESRQDFNRRYAVEKGRTALKLYDSVGSDRIVCLDQPIAAAVVELMTAVSLLLWEIDPKPAPVRPAPADDLSPGFTVTMTEVWDPEPWLPPHLRDRGRQ